jgi:hypothetical protein
VRLGRVIHVSFALSEIRGENTLSHTRILRVPAEDKAIPEEEQAYGLDEERDEGNQKAGA